MSDSRHRYGLCFLLFLLAGIVLGCTRPTREDEAEPAPPPWFQDVTAECGINFIHHAGAPSRYFIPQIAGSGLTSAIAYRWKTQFNENAKIPAFSHEIPELDHNEIVGWQGASELGRTAAADTSSYQAAGLLRISARFAARMCPGRAT